MKKQFLIFVFTFLTSFVVKCQSYTDSLEQLRKEKYEHLIDTVYGIFRADERENFIGLNYYPVNETYRINAHFEKNKGKKFKMQTSTERAPIYRRMGYLIFELNGQKCKLTVYQNVELSKQKEYRNYLFIPFRDATSGTTTYGGGRYIDFETPENENVLIDFNLAYNPYCAYSHRYSCPIPPLENTLTISVEAGEKIASLKEDSY